jgi:8-oxo-dGTP pyrophosphatase MutT (NUDIX family)
MPITSNGIIAFRVCSQTQEYQLLMIRRKDTLGYIDFMRAKFSLYQKSYILNMMKQMTSSEKDLLRKKYHIIRKEPNVSLPEKILDLIAGVLYKGEYYDLLSLLNESDRIGPTYSEPEWGFPKGRRNALESDYDCALREFCEETGYSKTIVGTVRNMMPLEEIFTGSNYNSYRHKYYLMHMKYTDSLVFATFQKSEVSCMEWKTIPECLDAIRPYNLEKKRVVHNVHQCLHKTFLCTIPNTTT